MSAQVVQRHIGSINLCSLSPFRMRAIVIFSHLVLLATANLTPERYQDDVLARLREDHLATLATKKAPSQNQAEAGYNKERLAHESWDTINDSNLEKASNLGGLGSTPPDTASPYEVTDFLHHFAFHSCCAPQAFQRACAWLHIGLDGSYRLIEDSNFLRRTEDTLSRALKSKCSFLCRPFL